VGEKMAKTLAKKFKSIDALSVATVEELDSLPDIAEITATDIYEYFRDPFNVGQIEGLKNVGVEPVMGEIAQVESIFTGKKVVLTGGLSSLSRKDASEKIERLGGITSSSVSKSTDYVIVGTDAGSKLDKAISLGVKTLNEEQFLQILSEHGLN
jgi:DNA ligase (NAD+)